MKSNDLQTPSLSAYVKRPCICVVLKGKGDLIILHERGYNVLQKCPQMCEILEYKHVTGSKKTAPGSNR